MYSKAFGMRSAARRWSRHGFHRQRSNARANRLRTVGNAVLRTVNGSTSAVPAVLSPGTWRRVHVAALHPSDQFVVAATVRAVGV